MATHTDKPKNTFRNIDRGNDPSGTDPNRHSRAYGAKADKYASTRKNKINNFKQKAMSNRNTIIGIVAGVAALAVVGNILRKRGFFDNFSEKAGEFGENVKEKFNDVKEKARQQFESAVDKGTEIADKAKTAKEDAKANSGKGLVKDTVDVATS